ncbi:unnamed protein product [Linum tenue]|uniref:Uncharacterized protein n=1 Tax=Linum tenue TaxID=586396 RepID=A0AAV0LEU1_9ROSI|nr:unnamed protein product [Linum tenue]
MVMWVEVSDESK